MYSGARTQLGDGASPFAIPNIGIDASQKAIQRGAVTLDETVKQYFKIQDFGEEQRLESEVRGLQSKFDVEFKRRASLAPGSSSQALYDSDGTLRESVLQDLSDEYAGKIGELRGGFVLPESRMKSDAMRQRVGDSFLNIAYQKAALLGIQRTRQAFDEGLKGDLLRKDYAAARKRYAQANQAGLITETAARNGIFNLDKTEAKQDYDNLAATNPDLAAEKINRGELDGYFSAAEQEQMMRSLRSHDDSRLTELIEQMASRPRTKNDKQAVTDTLLSGSVYKDQLEFDAVHQRDGDYSACAPQIDSFIYRVADQVKAGDEGADFASKKEEVIRLCKFYGKSSEFQKDILNRMDKWAGRKNEFPVLKVVDRMKEMAEMPLYRQADYNNAIGTLGVNADSAYELYLESAKGAGMEAKGKEEWMQEYKSKKVAELEKNLAAKTELAVRERFEAWYEGYKSIHNDKEPSSVIQEEQFQTLLREVTGRSDLVVPKRGNVMDAEQKKASTLWKMGDDERLKAGPELLSEGEKQALRRKEILRKPVTFPAMVSVDTVNTNAPAGILLPESMRKQFGDDLSGLAALVPSSPSSRRGKPLPVVGYTKESSPQLTLSGASKLRMTFSSKMDTNVTVSPASPEMREFFKREYPGSQDWKQSAGESKVPAAKLGGLGQYSQAFYDAGRKHGVDPKLLMAIAMHETGKGTSSAFLRKNNAMGISPNGGGPRSFDSVEESIDYAARLLKQHYLNQGLTTIESIGGKYAPAGAGNDPRGLNKHWVSGVSKYYKSF